MHPFIQSAHSVHPQHELINLIYSAAQQPSLWQQVLDALRKICGADQCTLFLYDQLDQRHSFAAAARTDEKIINLYLDEFITQQAQQINHQLAVLPEGRVVSDSDIKTMVGIAYSSIVGDKYMQNLWPRLHFQAGVVLLRNESGCAGLGLQSYSDSTSLEPAAMQYLQQLTPHIIQAIRINQRINQLKQTRDAFAAVLRCAHIGVVMLSRELSVTFANPEGSRVMQNCIGIQCELNRVLQLNLQYLPAADSLFPPATTAKKGKRKIEHTESCVKIEYADGHVKLSFFNISQQPDYPHHQLSNEACYLLLIQDSNRPCELPIQYLKQAYGITPAEAELVNHLINGASLVDAAGMRSVTHETARWQMKNIMEKTGTHSQAQLSRLMLALAD